MLRFPAFSTRAFARFVVVALVLALLSAVLVSNGRASSPRGSSPQWLAVINHYRAAAGLPPVVDDRAWDAGIRAHIRYLEHTPKRYLTGKYANLHSENPASPYYTAAGAREAAYSDLDEGEAPNGIKAINVWLTAPFHAIGMLRPGLKRVALAWDSRTGYAGLDVIHGLGAAPAGVPPANGQPVLFPGPNITTNLTAFGGEYPDPLQTCNWVGKTVGLPLIAMFAHEPAAGLSASLTTGSQTESTANGDLCVVDQRTYHSTDHIYGPTGFAILKDDNAVLLFPRHVLHNGSYTAQIQQPGQAPVSWQFSVNQGG